jgi:hypothetical protein
MGVEEKPTKIQALFNKRKQAGQAKKAPKASRGKPSY